MLDKGIPLNATATILRSYAEHIDFWKFGWGTAYVESQLADKLAVLHEHEVIACLGGTLMEIAWAQNAVDECLSWAHKAGFRAVEVSRGSVPMPLSAKSMIIRQASLQFTVLAETGYKSAERLMSLDEWSAEIIEDLDSGAQYVVTEGRESGTVGVYDHDGEPKPEVVRAVIGAAGLDRALFEAPRKSQQAWFVDEFGPDVNLGNIAPDDALALHTLRRGLRADTISISTAAVEPVRL
jgi:phosphosulfolactate synthase